MNTASVDHLTPNQITAAYCRLKSELEMAIKTAPNGTINVSRIRRLIKRAETFP